MEASTRIRNACNRHFSTSLVSKANLLKFSPSPSPHFPSIAYPIQVRSIPYCSTHFPSPISNPLNLGFPNPNSLFQFSTSRFASIVSDLKTQPFNWNFASDGVNNDDLGLGKDESPIFTVVLLGWLGSETKHLRRYAEMYNSRGIHTISLASPVSEVATFDFDGRITNRISKLTSELETWLSEKDGRERFLLFHTFSNTGWLSYGYILGVLQGRQDLLEKIKGCVVDSAPDADLNPKVWAAGFTAALLKKRNSSVKTAGEGVNKSRDESTVLANIGEAEPPFTEVFMLFLLEKIFSVFLKLPDPTRRLREVISNLWNNQPACPQLYLYSTADKVIPVKSIEFFMEYQRKKGIKVTSYDFGTSPHVDHYRTFPEIYSSQVHSFLKLCFEYCYVKQV